MKQTTDEGNIADNSFLALKVSPGKAYVKGFEVDKPVETFVTLDKARDTGTLGNLAIPFQMGNYYNLNNVYGMPEFGQDVSFWHQPASGEFLELLNEFVRLDSADWRWYDRQKASAGNL